MGENDKNLREHLLRENDGTNSESVSWDPSKPIYGDRILWDIAVMRGYYDVGFHTCMYCRARRKVFNDFV